MKIFSSLASLDQIRGSPLGPMLQGIVVRMLGHFHYDPADDAPTERELAHRLETINCRRKQSGFPHMADLEHRYVKEFGRDGELAQIYTGRALQAWRVRFMAFQF